MLGLLADVMNLPASRESAFLGRFQHLQRLKLIRGINPGRGKAAEYRAHQLLIIALAFQMIQLGMTPERVVKVMRENADRIRLSISISVGPELEVGHGIFWFDAAALSFDRNDDEGIDWAETTFDYGGFQTSKDRFAEFFDNPWIQRLSYVSVANTIWAILRAIEVRERGGDAEAYNEAKPELGEFSMAFLAGVRHWADTSEPDTLDG
jgi:hypothetical protein